MALTLDDLRIERLLNEAEIPGTAAFRSRQNQATAALMKFAGKTAKIDAHIGARLLDSRPLPEILNQTKYAGVKNQIVKGRARAALSLLRNFDNPNSRSRIVGIA
jgi:hypothetical protein